jgi:hypothetical protein
MKQQTPVRALLWIVGSLLLVPGSVYKTVRTFWEPQHTVDYLCRVVQTGPQKEALKTPYLAEVVQLSADKPVIAKRFDPLLAQRKLRLSPVIKSAFVKVIKPDTVFIDYTVRQPIAWLYDFENIALDDEGVPFPIIPFFTPKKLPEIVLGIKTFTWGTPLKDEKTALALMLLKMMLEKSLTILRLDVTASFAPSLGKREVVVVLEEKGSSKFLRLTPKNFAQELGNYLELRKTLNPEAQVIDLRIPQLAFIN